MTEFRRFRLGDETLLSSTLGPNNSGTLRFLCFYMLCSFLKLKIYISHLNLLTVELRKCTHGWRSRTRCAVARHSFDLCLQHVQEQGPLTFYPSQFQISGILFNNDDLLAVISYLPNVNSHVTPDALRLWRCLTSGKLASKVLFCLICQHPRVFTLFKIAKADNGIPKICDIVQVVYNSIYIFGKECLQN